MSKIPKKLLTIPLFSIKYYDYFSLSLPISLLELHLIYDLK